MAQIVAAERMCERRERVGRAKREAAPCQRETMYVWDGGMGMSRESRRVWDLGVGGKKQRQSGRQADYYYYYCRRRTDGQGCRAGPEAGWNYGKEAEAEAEARG